ncbi:hypothetical protein NESM_000295300 [Novymonas esmeraldas]|uniref:Bromo domain-containing protein n=1 Tax=Novymonas esmeraldas TaxID=1808958 RepID=A0AAW0F7Q2_9TRYP
MPLSALTGATADGTLSPLASAAYVGTAATTSVDLTDAIGVLWYAMMLDDAPRQERQAQQRRGVVRSRDGVALLSTTGPLEAWEGKHKKEEGKGDGSAETAAVAPDRVRSSTHSPTLAESSDIESGVWAAVDWTLLAANVYAITRELHTARAVERVVVEELLHRSFGGDRAAMCATYAQKRADILAGHARGVRAEEDEEERAATAAARLHSPSSVGAGAVSSGVCGSMWGTGLGSPAELQATPSPAAAAGVRAGAHSARPPITAAIRAPTHPGGGAVSAAPASCAAPTAVSESLSRDASASDRDATGSPPRAVESAAPAAPDSAPPPPVAGAVGGAGRGSAATEQRMGSAPPPHGQHRGSATAAVACSSSSGSGAPYEPDPLDAPWYALWCALPTPQARAQLWVLRYSTPLPPEDVAALLEQFLLVVGADDFLQPVHAATIMEFAGVRSGSYNTIVHAPMSLAEVRRCIADSHRHYVRATAAAAAHAGDGRAAPVGLQRPPWLDGATLQSTSPPPSTTPASSGGGGEVLAPSSSSLRHTRRGGAATTTTTTTPAAHGSDVRSLLDCTASSERRVLTVAELERSVWHIAANCVVFNAPESRYPRTARHFAAACISILTRYCEKQLTSFFTP